MGSVVRIAILANGSQARGEAQRTAASLGVIGTASSKAGKLLAGAFAVSSLVKVAAAVGKVGSEYVDSLNKIQALTGASDSTISASARQIEGQSKALAKYGFTASDATGGIVELAKSGLTLEKSMKAVSSVLVLAKAGELEVADASELVANTLNTFHLQARRAGDIANYLANAANISSSDVSDLAESFKYVSPLAAKSGITLGQTSAILAELSNSGIKASQAGTSLRGILVALQSPSDKASKALEAVGVQVYDAQGNMRPFKKVIEDLRTSLSGLDQQSQNNYLKDIFGRNSLTAATTLIAGGSKELGKYTEGVRRAGAAEALAASASRGLGGTVKSLRAEVQTTAESLYRQYSPAVNDALQAGLDWVGQQKDAASELLDHVGPAVKSVAELLGGIATATTDAAGPLAGKLLPALEGVFDIVKTGADALNKLPDGVKKIGVEAAIAALILPRLAASVTGVTTSVGFNIARLQQLRAELTYTATRTQLVSAAMTRFGAAAKSAAGIGGMVALTQGASTSNKALGTLLSTAGGAALGFSVAGPIGAAVGAVGGLTTSLLTSNDQVKTNTTSWRDYAGALDQATGAMTEQTKATVYDNLQKSGALKAGQALGLSQKDLVNASLGRAGASTRVAAAVEAEKRAVAGLTVEQDKAGQVAARAGAGRGGSGAAAQAAVNDLAKEALARKANISTIEGEIAASTLSREELAKKIAVTKGIPRRVVTDFQTDGVPKTISQVGALARQYKLTPKQIRSVVTATGVDASKKQIDKLIARLGDVSKTKTKLPSLKPAVNATVAEASTGALNVAKALKQGTGKAKADLGGFRKSVVSGIGQAEPTASTGGRGVGAALQDGVIAGFSGTAARLAAAARGAVNAAVAEARAAGKIKSPSRETRYIGEMLGRGLEVGMDSRKAAASAGGSALINAALAGLYDFAAQPITGVANDAVSSSIDAQTSLIETTFADRLTATQRSIERVGNAQSKKLKKKLDGKAETKALAGLERRQDKAGRRAEKASTASVKRVTASLQGQYAALRNVANQYDTIRAAQEKNQAALDSATSTYQGLVDQSREYADSVRDSVVDSGSVVGLGRSATSIVAALRKKLLAAQAYSATIQALTASGLNPTTIKQLTDAGVEAGSATAAAILAGGPDAVASINYLTGQLVGTGEQLGTSVAGTLYDAGIAGANAIVAGLATAGAALDAQAAALQAQAVVIGQAIAAGLAQGLASSAEPEKAGKKAGKGAEKGAKNHLKTKSPSRLFREIGRNTAEGLAIGLGDVDITARAAKMAAKIERGYGTPALDAFSAYTSSGGGTAVLDRPTAGSGPLIGTVMQQPGESTDALAERLWFKLRSRA